MEEKITKHLQRLIDEGSKAVGLQFKRPLEENTNHVLSELDPLGEEAKYSPVKGITHKFGNRALFKVSYRCAAHCRFCTRIRQIGTSAGDLKPEERKAALSYIRNHPEIDDVILSGGDPLYTPHITFELLRGLSKISSVKVIRIGTRLPIHLPEAFDKPLLKKVLREMRRISKQNPLYVLVNISHPDELTELVDRVLQEIRRNCTYVLSQTVFQKGVNDNVEVLTRLFNKLYHMGIKPYYLYRCDYVKGVERFICDINEERRIVSTLRRTLSGIAVPEYIVDVPGRGKIPPPLDFWDGVDLSQCRDYDGKPVSLLLE